ncbi:hypothetical protein PCC9214_05809 [Planktothrix tepida]|uniref:CHAT domain-containing protein n=1 Tax=Planktothrix tepida PCC 9214 TaxID=671072 RepID=A0A1J1LS22_9CYAN|nr:CHAT domain-containing protein [Planktothrix tepida]CAD5990491.1 hypothetical protein PCC9214_05809 [Planktothrix tepida]CUR35403.1 hypothetical protein PL9214670029 [Planktothrix tepida PCC 9214]
MINCLVCGESIAEQDEVCPVCGTEIASLESPSASERITNLSHTPTPVVNLVSQPEEMGNQKNLMPTAEENIHAFLHKLEIQSSSGEGEENIYALVKSLITHPSLDLQAENLWLSPAQRTIYAFFKLLVDQATWLPQSELLNLWQQIHPNLGTPDLISDTILNWCEKHSLTKYLIDIRKTLPGGELNRTKGEHQEHSFRRIPDSEVLYNEMFESVLIGASLATSSPLEEISRPSENILDTPRNNLVSQKVEVSDTRGGRNFPPSTPVTKVSDTGGNVVRYTKISCPRRVWVDTPEISVVVWLTVQPPKYSSASIGNFSVYEGQPVLVRVEALDFISLNDPAQERLVKPNADSEPIVFLLKPDKVVERTKIEFDFFQNSRWLACSQIEVEITDYKVEAQEVQESVPISLLEINSPQPDYTLVVKYDENQNPLQLSFELFQGQNKREKFYSSLNKELKKYAQYWHHFLEKLNKITAPSRKLETPEILIKSPSDINREIKNFGHNLWRELIPSKLQKIYANQRLSWHGKKLLIVSDDPYIPWELVWPTDDERGDWEDSDPWCMTMCLTRWLRRDEQDRVNQRAPIQLSLNSLTCIVPTDLDLPAAEEERNFLKELLSNNNILDLSPTLPTLPAVRKILESSQYNWFHVVTHGTFCFDNPDANSSILLQYGDLLTPDEIIGQNIVRHINRNRPGFVFNACSSGRQGWGLTHLGGWVNRLIHSGAGLFLAPCWAVDDKSALFFAQRFYSYLLQGKTVSEAVHQSRIDTRQNANRCDDLTWLAYSVYADPNAKVILNGKLEETM